LIFKGFENFILHHFFHQFLGRLNVYRRNVVGDDVGFSNFKFADVIKFIIFVKKVTEKPTT
jgi:hypothetical protein